LFIVVEQMAALPASVMPLAPSGEQRPPAGMSSWVRDSLLDSHAARASMTTSATRAVRPVNARVWAVSNAHGGECVASLAGCRRMADPSDKTFARCPIRAIDFCGLDAWRRLYGLRREPSWATRLTASFWVLAEPCSTRCSHPRGRFVSLFSQTQRARRDSNPQPSDP
jgi:hypothetical protein